MLSEQKIADVIAHKKNKGTYLNFGFATDVEITNEILFNKQERSLRIKNYLQFTCCTNGREATDWVLDMGIYPRAMLPAKVMKVKPWLSKNVLSP